MKVIDTLLTIVIATLLTLNIFFGYEISNKDLTSLVLVSLLPRIKIDFTSKK